MILKSGLFESREVQEILEAPEEWIESQEYFSWERYFTKLLIQESQETFLKYNKNKINRNYLHEKSKKLILEQITGIKFRKSRQD